MAYHSMLDRAKLCDECAKKKADGSCKFGTPTPAR